MVSLPYVLMAICGLGSVIAVYLAIVERDLLKAAIISAIQSTLYAFLYYLLMAPDIVLTYIPVAVGLYPAVILFLIKKTERYEDVETRPSVAVAVGLSATVLVISLAIAVAFGGLGPLPPMDVRSLAYTYLVTTYNPMKPVISALAPEGVTAIVWDYRGLDTVFETAVLFLAIIGSVAIMRGVEKLKFEEVGVGLTVIGKTVTRLTIPMIVGVAISIALHGHLTPGGGFQGGATLAIAPLIVLVMFSRLYLEKLGVTKDRMLVLRSIGLLGVGATAVAVLIAALLTGGSAYILQNQVRVGSPYSMPSMLDGIPLGGTLLYFNIFEALAVAAGFTLLFLLLSIPEEVVRKVVVGEEHG